MNNQIKNKRVTKHLCVVQNKKSGLIIKQFTNLMHAQQLVDELGPHYEIVE